ncbi:sulfur carrier protein ThiS [Stackebrandtia endophytica]|uniref:Sulfur carrier protein ThiS n=1 Tax=Stackebrandtia endophytica TaxID=1496996 RepID=A0A543B070_9ACTN|nr:sulfur carrier protein ThiS [Stackebrandtia endophytica]TQL78224.1 sulfur carrier protein ThiS [Stackebrandtia endophytica]
MPIETRVLINGVATVIPGDTVEVAVAAITDTTRGIAVAVNGEVVPGSRWHRRLSDGDQIEILTAVQGG